jgi:CRISPR-associated protein Cmr2
MNNTYIAITIGPIYKTFRNVRRTRELWAASFCFSFLMRNINDQLRHKGIESDDFILPYFKEEEKKGLFELKGYGLFPDRLIFKSKEGDLELLMQSIDKAFDILADKISGVIGAKDHTKVLDFLKGYFQISYIEKELTEKEMENVILGLSPYLDSLEQQNKYVLEEPKPNYLYQFFEKVNDRKDDKETFLDEHFEIQDINGNKRVESLIEISTRELRKPEINYVGLVNSYLWEKKGQSQKQGEDKPDKATDTDFLDALVQKCRKNYTETENPFRSYHKYYCIIQGDGDKIGTTLQGLNTVDRVKDFSIKLINWAKETYKAVKGYGGVPIYVGGDDLLCIVPVANGAKNVFDLMSDIDRIFKHEFPDAIPTLSFGLSITYYKYPLGEAIDKVYHLLKQAKEEGGNRIAAQIIKHSGNEMVTVFDKSSDLYRQTLTEFLKVLNNEDALSSGISYKLRDNAEVIKQIGLLPKRITYFINHLTDSEAELIDRLTDSAKQENEYNKLEDKEKFAHLIKETVARVYRQKANEIIEQNMDKISEAAMKEIFSMLRIVKFVKGLDDDKS